MSAVPPMQPAPTASSKPKDGLDMGSASRTPVRGGYARLARFMGDVPNAAIFRRFMHLSAEVLLHHQSELCDLEAELKRVQEEDHLSTDIRKFYSSLSRSMRESEYCYQDDSSDIDSIVEAGDENDPDDEEKGKSENRGNINDEKDPSGESDGDVIRDEHKAQRAQWLLLKRIREVTRDYCKSPARAVDRYITKVMGRFSTCAPSTDRKPKEAPSCLSRCVENLHAATFHGQHGAAGTGR